jgi:hypothetical protein
VLSALSPHFRDYQIFVINDGDIVIVATNRPEGLTPDWSVVSLPNVASDLSNLPAWTPNLLEALRAGDRALFDPLVRGLPPNSDYHPRLDLGAEKARFLGQTAEGFLMLHDDRFALCWTNAAHRVEPLPDFPVPAPAVPRQRDLSMSAALQQPPSRTLANDDPRLPEALQRRHEMQLSLFGGGPPPADWRAWVLEFVAAEQDWHLGTLGVVDDGMYRLAEQVMDRRSAPPEAHAAVRFLHDAGAWRFSEASREADALIDSAAQGQDWLPPAVLLDGALAAKLVAGDLPGARRAFETLRSRAGWDPSELRSRLLLARLAASQVR